MKYCNTFEVKIYVGARVGYTEEVLSRHIVDEICQEYCDEVGLCVTVTDTKYIYTKGNEPGYIIGLINYPRFPKSPPEIVYHAGILAEKLMINMRQKRVTIVTPSETFLLENVNG